MTVRDESVVLEVGPVRLGLAVTTAVGDGDVRMQKRRLQQRRLCDWNDAAPNEDKVEMPARPQPLR